MKLIFPIIICLIFAFWLIAIAILSVQNATVVSLKFLSWQSIQMPVGIVLAMSAGVGLLGGAFAQLLLKDSE
ncbi:MAG TPA: lipopolysaccharide assembly protein LapA domain-containing protein [Halomicronema sp.]